MKRIAEFAKMIASILVVLIFLVTVFLWTSYMVGSAVIVALHWGAFILLSFTVAYFVN